MDHNSRQKKKCELLELLHDAQVRLKQALDVSTGNEIKRSMLSRDHQVEEDKFTDANGAFGASIYEPDEYYGYIL